MKYPLGEKTNSAKGGLSFSLAVVIYILLSAFWGVLSQTAGLLDSVAAKYIGYLLSPLAICIALAVSLKLGAQPPKQVFPVRCKPKYYLIALLLVFGLMFSLSSVNGYLVQLLEMMGYTPRSSTLPDLSGWGIVWAVLVIALLPAVAEEALFRGVMANNMADDAGTVRTVFLVGFAFALYHGSVEQTVYQFICGCLFTLLALRSGSVLPSVLIHFLNNALILIFYRFNLVDALGNLALPQAAYIALTVCSAVSLAAAFALLVFDKSPVKPARTGGVSRFFLWGSAGLFILILIWILGLFAV